LILSIENGAAKVIGKPEFYQLNSIGGRKLRGYRRERFWGETIYHNNNELQFLFDVKSILFNGKAGIISFYDQGRVWLKGEKSNSWHYGYGGGIILSPFNKVYVSVVYGLSDDKKSNGTFHLDFRRTIQ
jgi:hemolysin activation/secretion protein